MPALIELPYKILSKPFPIGRWLDQDGGCIFTGALLPELVTACHEQGRALLALPPETLRLYESQPERPFPGGYLPPGRERVRELPPDLFRHCWDVFPRDTEKVHVPSQAEAFAETAKRLSRALEEITRLVFTALDREWGTSLAQDARNGPHHLRLSQYISNVPDGRVLFPDHVDFGLFTLFVGGSLEGLQYQDRTSAWRPLPLALGSIAVGVGTTLRLLRPRVRAFRHRVIATSNGRVSSVFFTELEPQIRLPNGKTAGEHFAQLSARVRVKQ